MNISLGPNEDRHLMSGLHTVNNIYCSSWQLAADTGLEICKFDRILYSLCRLQVHVLLQSAYVDLDLSPNSCKNQNHPQLDPNL